MSIVKVYKRFAQLIGCLPVCFSFFVLPALSRADIKVQLPGCEEKLKPNQSTVERIDDLSAFGRAMTEGMLLSRDQADLFTAYRYNFLGNPKRARGGKSFQYVHDFFAMNPEFAKLPFRHIEISQEFRFYPKSAELMAHVASRVRSAGQVKERLFQIQANFIHWRKLLDYQDDSDSGVGDEETKRRENGIHNNDLTAATSRGVKSAEAERRLNQKRQFQNYLNRIISAENQELLMSDNLDEMAFEQKAILLFKTLHEVYREMERHGRRTLFIRQALVDIVHIAPFYDPLNKHYLKSENALEVITGLKRVFRERDELAARLGFEGGFEGLCRSFSISVPSGLPDSRDQMQWVAELEKRVLQGNFELRVESNRRVRPLSIHEAGYRSDLAGDCATESYFDTALDPNFQFFTFTDKRCRSKGFAAIVLGEATEDSSGQAQKIAFLDKIQGVSEADIDLLLYAISLSIAERGYVLGIPHSSGSTNGVSNTASVRSLLQADILTRSRKSYSNFHPHPGPSKFSLGKSRAGDSLTVGDYVAPKLERGLQLVPGKMPVPFPAPQTLNHSIFAREFLKLKDSNLEEDLIKFSKGVGIVAELSRRGIYSIDAFLKDLSSLAENPVRSFTVRKAALVAVLRLFSQRAQIGTGVHPKSDGLRRTISMFSDSEIAQITGEVLQWPASSESVLKDAYYVYLAHVPIDGPILTHVQRRISDSSVNSEFDWKFVGSVMPGSAWIDRPEVVAQLINKSSALHAMVASLFSRPEWSRYPKFMAQLIEKMCHIECPSLVRLLGAPHWIHQSDLVNELFEKGSPENFKFIADFILFDPQWKLDLDFIHRMIRTRKVGGELARGVLTRPDIVGNLSLLRELMKQANVVDQIVQSVLSQPGWEHYPEIVMDLIQDPKQAKLVCRYLLSQPQWAKNRLIFDAIFSQGTSDVELVTYVLSQPHWAHEIDAVKMIVARGTADKELAAHVLVHPSWSKFPELVNTLLERGNADLEIIKLFAVPEWFPSRSLLKSLYERNDPNIDEALAAVLAGSHWLADPELLEGLVERASVDSKIAAHVFTKAHWGHRSDLLKAIVARGHSDETIVYLTMENPALEDADQLIRPILDRGNFDGPLLRALSEGHWVKFPHLVEEIIDRNPDMKQYYHIFFRSKVWYAEPRVMVRFIQRHHNVEYIRAVLEQGADWLRLPAVREAWKARSGID